jgi:hypothetical protein
MTFGSIGERLIFAAAIIAFLLLFSLIRRNPQKARTEVVRGLLTEFRINIILVETFELQPKQRKFTTTGWQLHKKKIGFLDKSVQDDLSKIYGIALDYNRRLQAAKKIKSAERVKIDIEGMRELLPRIQTGLEDWLLANVGNIDESERPSMFGGLFGR